MIELANQAGVDALVIGTHQKTGLDRLGSVSSIVVHDAPQSVVCVPPNANLPTICVPRLTRALVATDLSSFANRAVPFAFALTAPIVVFAMLNLRAAQATDQRGEFAFADYVHLRLVCLTIAGAVEPDFA